MPGLCCSNVFDSHGSTVLRPQTLCIDQSKDKSDYYVFNINDDKKANEKYIKDGTEPDKKEGTARCQSKGFPCKPSVSPAADIIVVPYTEGKEINVVEVLKSKFKFATGDKSIKKLNWTRVRHVPAGNRFHPATDQLDGTEEYGDPLDDEKAWSIKWDKSKVKHFKFATGNDLKWLIAASDQVYGFYTNADKAILMSSTSEKPYKAKWYRRKGIVEDPWISLKDHEYCIKNNCILYGENTFAGQHTKVLSSHDGADVFINTQEECLTDQISIYPDVKSYPDRAKSTGKLDSIILTLSSDKKGKNEYLFSIGSTKNIEKSNMATATIFVCGLETLTLKKGIPDKYEALVQRSKGTHTIMEADYAKYFDLQVVKSTADCKVDKYQLVDDIECVIQDPSLTYDATETLVKSQDKRLPTGKELTDLIASNRGQ